jgi:hypothetical protein
MTRPSTPPVRGPGYETRDVRVKPILYVGAGFVVVAVIIQVAMWLMFEGFAARESRLTASDRPLAAELRRQVPPEPRLQSKPRDDLLSLRAWEDRMLTTYALVDHDNGVVRIPIERAMDLLIERGLPVRKEKNDGER